MWCPSECLSGRDANVIQFYQSKHNCRQSNVPKTQVFTSSHSSGFVCNSDQSLSKEIASRDIVQNPIPNAERYEKCDEVRQCYKRTRSNSTDRTQNETICDKPMEPSVLPLTEKTYFQSVTTKDPSLDNSLELPRTSEDKRQSKKSPILACIWWQNSENQTEKKQFPIKIPSNAKRDEDINDEVNDKNVRKQTHPDDLIEESQGCKGNEISLKQTYETENCNKTEAFQKPEFDCHFAEKNMRDTTGKMPSLHKKSFSESYLKEYKQVLAKNKEMEEEIKSQKQTSKIERRLQSCIFDKGVVTQETVFPKMGVKKVNPQRYLDHGCSTPLGLRKKNVIENDDQRHVSWDNKDTNRYQENLHFVPYDADACLETPISLQNAAFLSLGKEFLVVPNGTNQVVLYECSCKLCDYKGGISNRFRPYTKNSHSSKSDKRKDSRMKKMLNTCFKAGNTDSSGSDISRTNNTSSSSSSGGSDTENDDDDASGGREEYQEHGGGESGDEDSGGGDSDGDTEVSFDSAELFDNLNTVPEAKLDFDDENGSDGPGMESDNSDSLSELQAMRCKKNRKTDDEDDTGDDTCEDDDEFSDWWETLTIYDE